MLEGETFYAAIGSFRKIYEKPVNFFTESYTYIMNDQEMSQYILG